MQRLKSVSLLSVAREVALVLSAYMFYFLVRGFTQGSQSEAVSNAHKLIATERDMGILWEPSMQAAILSEQTLVTIFNWIYVWGHWPFIGVVALFMFIYKPDTYRLIRNAFFISGGIGLIIFMTFPVAPPRLLDLDFVDTVKMYSTAYRVLQPPSLVNQYAAVPSFHFGWNLLIGVALFRQFKAIPIRLIAVTMPALMFLAIVLTANHYILDAVIGGAIALLGLGIAGLLRRAGREHWFARISPSLVLQRR